MAVTIKDFAVGRKTFFITPDLSLFPENFLEEFFALGFECYFVENLKTILLEEQIEAIISVFQDVILFFNIDFNIPGINWYAFIKNLQEKHPEIFIGVMFVKRPDREVKNRLEKLFNYDLGIKCGCVQLEYQRNANFWIIQKILFANQAQGRRKTIRALCTGAYTFSFELSGQAYDGALQDISLSHFSFIYPKDKMIINSYEKIDNIHFHLKGLLIRSDAVLIMQRHIGEDVLNVFAFLDENGMNGLTGRYKQLLLPNIYELMSTNYKNLMAKVLQTRKDDNNIPSDVEDLEINL